MPVVTRVIVSSLAVALVAGCAGGPRQRPEPPDRREVVAMQEPGEHHAHLDPLAGRFRARVTIKGADGGEQMIEGKMETRWAVGGRFLISRFSGGPELAPFEGAGLMGYDTNRDEYVATWTDSSTTMLWPLSYGTCSEDGHVIEMTRDMWDPFRADTVHQRAVTTIVNRDKNVYQVFETDLDGSERETVMIIFERAAGSEPR